MNNKRGFLIIIMAIAVLLFPLAWGIPPIRNLLIGWIPQNDFWFGYMSYIGAILAIFTALFIVKWQDLVNNKKNINIKWKHLLRSSGIERCWDVSGDFSYDNKFNFIQIKISNTGNRLINIASMYLHLSSQCNVVLSKHLFTDETYSNVDIQFPCRLDVEETAALHIPMPWLCETIEVSIKDNRCYPPDKIAITVVDTTDQKYSLRTNIANIAYLEYYRDFKSKHVIIKP